MIKTPIELGYRMPAEWEPHEGTWLTWPKDDHTFPGEFLEKIQNSYIDIINIIKKGEKIFLLTDNEKTEEFVSKKLEERGFDKKNIFFQRIESGDIWIRDYGPIFVKKGRKIAAVKWVFNNWGNKYEYFEDDDKTGEKIAKILEKRIPIFRPKIVMEGGSLETNGIGTFMTTEQCLLNKNRNPTLKKEEIEKYIKNYLGAENIIWLKEGIEGDDTEGHIDDIARFVNEDTVVLAVEDNSNDKNSVALRKNIKILENIKIKNEKIEVIKLPMPRSIKELNLKRRGEINFDDRRLPASYANFYIANKSVLVPVFSDKNDETALKILQNAFPKKDIIPIQSIPFIVGFGAIHCATQQQPL